MATIQKIESSAQTPTHLLEIDAALTSKNPTGVYKVIDKVLQRIQGIVKNQRYHEDEELQHQLDILTNFFRKGNYTSQILPTLLRLSQTHKDIWSQAKVNDTNIKIQPSHFEKLSSRDAETERGFIVKPATREREMALLRIYGVSVTEVGRILSSLPKR